MANYYASARSNWFQVNDIEKFKKDLPSEIEVEDRILEVDGKEIIQVAMFCQYDAGWPSEVIDPHTDEPVEFEIEKCVRPHLLDGEWCVIQEIGSEKLRYLIGYSVAFNNKGERDIVDINDIYSDLPSNVSRCEY